MALLPLVLLILVLPLGAAGQNIGISVAALLLITRIVRRLRSGGLKPDFKTYAVPFLASFAFIAVVLLASALNTANPRGFELGFLWGYLPWALLPWVVANAYGALTTDDWRKLETALAVVCGVIGGTAVSQALFGWHVEGSTFVMGSTRAQGYFSHPLTFAYVALLLFPYGCVRVVRTPGSWQGWFIFVGAAVAIYASQSRTVQIIAAIMLFLNVLLLARGRYRLVLLGGALTCGLVIAATDNPVSRKFGNWAQGGWDTHSEYPDDRIVFWLANWEMVKERPIFGHGDDTNAAYRAPYYERIGLGDFPRQYEAHNMYLQTLVSGGVIAFAGFLVWLVWNVRAANRIRARGVVSIAPLETLIAFALAGMTQNAFQDAEVRYVLTLVITATWLTVGRRDRLSGGAR